MLVKTFSSAVYGINATTVTVETLICPGLHYYIVGLPDSAIKESLHRIESAITSAGYRMPRQKIVINLAPAAIRKEGSAYDLSMAIGILAASEQIRETLLTDYLVLGELSLDGNIQPIKGALPVAIQAKQDGFKGIILPLANAREAAAVQDLEVLAVENLQDVIHFFTGHQRLRQIQMDIEHEFLHQIINSDADSANL